jgi:hypothetical protein
MTENKLEGYDNTTRYTTRLGVQSDGKFREYTPEEKADYWKRKNAEQAIKYERKDRMIVRQNSLAHATMIALHNHPNQPVSTSYVIKLAEELEIWVMR